MYAGRGAGISHEAGTAPCRLPAVWPGAAAEFVAANTSCHYLEATNIARVNAAGVEDEAGEYYQFAWVITNMEDHYQDNLVAVSYMEYEGKLYFNVSKEASVASVAETYVTEGIVADEVLVNVLKKLYE